MNNQQFKRISVIGLGYIGLPTAAMFASRKIEVIGVDVDQYAVDTINNGQIHIVEPDLDMAVHAAVREGYLRASTTPEPAEAFLIAVPTPFNGANRQPDLSYIEAASRAIAPVLEKDNIVILESTSPVGATETMAGWLAQERPDLSFPQAAGSGSDVRIAYCPERVLPGKVMQELVMNDRVIGGMTEICSDRAIQLYQTFVKGTCVKASGPRAAEMTKLTENSFRDVNIAFANELSLICSELGLDVWELISLANRHPRVEVLQPGPGVGGHCIAVDPWFIVSSAPQTARLIRVAREVNDSKPQWVLDQVTERLTRQTKTSRAGQTIAVYGLAFKPNTDDLRESPAYAIAKEIAAMAPGRVLCVEPHLSELPSGLVGAEFIGIDEALERAAIHVFLVAHSVFISRLSNLEFDPAQTVDACGLLKKR